MQDSDNPYFAPDGQFSSTKRRTNHSKKEHWDELHPFISQC